MRSGVDSAPITAYFFDIDELRATTRRMRTELRERGRALRITVDKYVASGGADQVEATARRQSCVDTEQRAAVAW